MAPSHDQAINPRIDVVLRQTAQHRADVSDEKPACRWKPLSVDVALAVVHDPDVKIDFRGQSCHGLPNMTAADDQQGDARGDGQVSDPTLGHRPGPPGFRPKTVRYVRGDM